MSEVKMRACDVCHRAQNQEELKRYELKVDGDRIVVDLCNTHDRPLRELLARLPDSVRQGRKRSAMADSFVPSLSAVPRDSAPTRRPAKKAAAKKTAAGRKR